MTNRLGQTFPGGSRQRVAKAGARIREGVATNEDIAVIDTWREAHRHVINSFQAMLRNRTRDTNIVVAQRHKRKRTIVDKLNRYPTMQLNRMDDVAGCRLIFDTIDDIHAFRESFHDARFNHKLRNVPDRYDYISHPKFSGYRGIHDIYEYDSTSMVGRDYKGLLLEVQYRTFPQHAWATCVELVGFLTENQPKFDRGEERIKMILRLSSEIIARSVENMKSSLPDLIDTEVVQKFLALDSELHFMSMLNKLNATDRTKSNHKNYILVFREKEDDPVEIFAYPSATNALRALFALERDKPGLDAVLVKGDTAEDIREAFKNYFSDARNFIELIEAGCTKLSGHVVVPLDSGG